MAEDSSECSEATHFPIDSLPIRTQATSHMGRVVISALILMAIIDSIGLINAKPCSPKELGVFNDVTGQVGKCLQESKLNFQMPPRSSLSKVQQSALCKSKACQMMIGSVDDLDIPNCEATFDKKNMTLQTSLDKFVSACDMATPAPSPIKRRKSFESSSSGSSGSFPKNRYTNVATAVQFGTLQQLLVLVVVAILSLGLVLP